MDGNIRVLRLTLDEILDGRMDAVITAWHVSPNDAVKKGDDLAEVVTDKASFDVPSPCDGVLVSIVKESGSSVKIGEVIAEILPKEEVTHSGIGLK